MRGQTLKQPLVSKGMLMPFILITLCFAAWGTAANMTDPLVKVFSKIFTMSNTQSALVQFCYYGAYFCLAIPAALINKYFSYKTGVLVGLGCATVGAFLFYPASQAMTFGAFLTALFILAGGLSILETSANPYVMAMGSDSNATRRLNLAQAFNPVGTNVGVFIAATFILPNLHPATASERAAMAPQQLSSIQAQELSAVMTPYVAMACILLLIWIAIASTKPPADIYSKKPRDKSTFALQRLLGNPRYRYGVMAQFFNVGAQTCVWTFTIQYVMEALSANETRGGEFLQYSMILFLIARFSMTWLMGFVRPSALLTIMAITASLLSAYLIAGSGASGVWALVAISACLSLMFPTIYGLSLQNLGEDTKFGAAGLVMAILGGALMPLAQARLMDLYGVYISYIIPAICFLFVAIYAIYAFATESKCTPKTTGMAG